MKRDFKVVIRRVEVCTVSVRAGNEQEARDLALSMESRGMVDNHVYDDECVDVLPLE